MRSLLVALAGLALFVPAAPAATIEIEEHVCGCDGSSGEEDTRGIAVRAAPGEVNALVVRRVPRGIVIEDAGAPLTGECRPVRTGSGRFCRGEYDGVDMLLGDGNDRLEHATAGGTIDAGPGDDDVRMTTATFHVTGGPGADRLDATGALLATVSYADHADGVTVRLNGLADDGAAGEGDNVLGPVTGITGGAGDDLLEAGGAGSSLFGGGGRDRLVGSPERDTLNGAGGDDELLAGAGDDYLTGGLGADVLGGGDGIDEVSYGVAEPLRLSIGDGPNDGTAGEGDDIRADVEGLTGGRGDDVLIGDEDANRLIAYGGRDVLRGGAGEDRLIGWNDGDELEGGAGGDRLRAGARDRPLLRDGELDHLNCNSSAPAIESDVFDVLGHCAPPVTLRPRGRVRPGRPVPLTARCPAESAVRCEGFLVLRRRRGRRLSRRVAFGPLEPGERSVVTPRLRAGLRRGACVYATAVSFRPGRPGSSTARRSPLACLG